jgi:thymidylate synthase
MSFILYMINYFVMKPNECKITEIILTSTSAHIYENDQDSAVDVGGIHWSREEDKSLLHQSLGFLRAIYDYVKGQN